MLIEGHTDAKPFSSEDGYSNWELSTDRANSARKLMQASGIRPEQVAQVRGFADRQLRHPEDPKAASNRRISVIVQYLTPPEAPQPKAEGEKSREHESRTPSRNQIGEAAEAQKADRALGKAGAFDGHPRRQDHGPTCTSGISMPRMPAVRSSWRRKKSVIHSRKTFFSRFSSWMMGY